MASSPTRFRELHKQFGGTLAEIQKERKTRPDFVEVTIRGHKYTEPAWAIFEVESMLAEVNKIRAAEGQFPAATMDDLWRVEGFAKGHSDYSMKFSLYCAELALYGKVDRP